MVDIEAIFEIFADNPPSILIAGGFLCMILGAFFQAANETDVASNLYTVGVIGIGAGILLQIMWLQRR